MGVSLYFLRKYGGLLRNQNGIVTANPKTKTITVIVIISPDFGLICYRVVETSVNKVMFKQHPIDIVKIIEKKSPHEILFLLLDNARLQGKEQFDNHIEKLEGLTLKRLPQYSLFLNTIEEFFSVWKHDIGRKFSIQETKNSKIH
ncbi:hypothetical protein QTN25_003724 [Entamoeba marina]